MSFSMIKRATCPLHVSSGLRRECKAEPPSWDSGSQSTTPRQSRCWLWRGVWTPTGWFLFLLHYVTVQPPTTETQLSFPMLTFGWIENSAHKLHMKWPQLEGILQEWSLRLVSYCGYMENVFPSTPLADGPSLINLRLSWSFSPSFSRPSVQN